MGTNIRQNRVFNSRGQAIIEYAVYIVMAALIFLALFARSNLKGVIQGRWRDDVTSIGKDQYSPSSTTETVPYTAQLTTDTMTDLAGFGPGNFVSGGSPYRAHRDEFF